VGAECDGVQRNSGDGSRIKAFQCQQHRPSAAAPLTPYATVTDERLQHPEAGDWLMYRRTYDGRASAFEPNQREEHRESIPRLVAQYDLVDAHETTPIVNHGRISSTRPAITSSHSMPGPAVSFGGM